MSIRKIRAVLRKQQKETIKNPIIIIMYIFFPIMSIILTETVAKNKAELPDTYFAVLFAIIFTGLIPIVSMAGTISEEKEKNTLRVLVMSNVKPSEYLLGTGIHLLSLCGIGILLFGIIGAYTGMNLVRFIIILIAGCITSLLAGAAIGIISSSPSGAYSLAIPIAVITAYLPMIAGFSSPVKIVSRFLYTQQINYLIEDPSAENFLIKRFIIIFINFVIFLFTFITLYKKRLLKEYN